MRLSVLAVKFTPRRREPAWPVGSDAKLGPINRQGAIKGEIEKTNVMITKVITYYVILWITIFIVMKTINVSISELEYNKFGIKNENLSFSDFVELVSRELSRQNLYRCIELSEKYDLSSTTSEDITKEVKAVRKNAKSHN